MLKTYINTRLKKIQTPKQTKPSAPNPEVKTKPEKQNNHLLPRPQKTLQANPPQTTVTPQHSSPPPNQTSHWKSHSGQSQDLPWVSLC